MENGDTQLPMASKPATLATLMPGRVLAERYRVDGMLGEGGMAVVFEGHHLGLDRAIAIKVLKPEFVAAPQVLARFEQEARAVSRLEHPGIVKMFDVGTAELPGMLTPIAYLVMERLRGAELSDVLRKDAPIPPLQALDWLEDLLAAIGHAHAREVVHRDLKPENIFINETPEGRVLKLVDFGIAKLVQPSGAAPLTQMGMIFGTPSYMSPEQATGLPVDARTDLYSAGIIFYEMLSGRVPFDAPDMMEMLRKQVKDPPPPLPVAPVVGEVLSRLLAKAPEHRYADAAEALRAVKAAKRALGGPARVPMAPTIPQLEVGTPVDASTRVPGSTATLAPEAPRPALDHRRPTPSGTARTVGLAAAGSLTLGLVLWAASGGSEAGSEAGAVADTGAVAPGGEVPHATAAAVGAEEPAGEFPMPLPFTTPTASDEALAPVDAALKAGKRPEARALLAQLLADFPKDPDVLWRAGLAEGTRDEASARRAEFMRDAIDVAPSRLDDAEVAVLVLQELARPEVPEPFIDLVVRHGEPIEAGWTKALLGRPSSALPYAQRTRLLEVAEPSDTWSPAVQRCLDLWQASTTDRPCTVYGETLDAMRDTPSASYRRTLEHAAIPTDPGAQESAEACEDLKARRDALLEALADAPGEGGYVPDDFASKATKKRGGRRRGPLGRLFGR